MAATLRQLSDGHVIENGVFAEPGSLLCEEGGQTESLNIKD
jgi:hypothetical protein